MEGMALVIVYTHISSSYGVDEMKRYGGAMYTASSTTVKSTQQSPLTSTPTPTPTTSTPTPAPTAPTLTLPYQHLQQQQHNELP